MARNNILTSPNLTKEELTQLYQVSRDPFYFSTFIKVVNPVHGVVNFDLYPYQRSVLYQFLKERFNIILKFRQAGITELISLYCLWLCMYHPNKKVNIISIKDTVAKKVLKKIKFMYKNLPSHLQTPIINGRVGEYGSATSMEFSNGSLIESIPTSENAGRSESLSLLVIDEAAAVRWAASIWASALPTLSTGGAAIVNSCVTGDTEIVTRKGLLRIDTVCPKEKGISDISALGIEVLTHNLKWKKVLASVNKGKLTTWDIKTTKGTKLSCTPAHKLLTTWGWKPVKEILEKDLNVIEYDLGLDSRKAVNRYPLQVVGIIQEICPKVKHLWAKGSNNSKGYQNLIVKEVFNRTGILIDTKYLSKIIKGTRWSGLTLSKIQVLREYKAEIFDISVEDDQSYFVSPCLPSHNTPLGLGGFYHSTWVDALSHSNGFNPLRLRWQMHPERDERWYQEMARALGPKKTAQEIDGDFLSSGNTVFDPADIRAIEECLSEYVVIKSRFSGQYKEFNEVDPNGEYFIGADCATGRATDYSSFTCMNRDGEEVAIFKGRIPLDQYAKLLGDTGEKFNFAMLAPETNDIGAAVTSMLQTEGYPNLYHYQKLLKKKGKSKPDIELVPGWLTTTKNRSVIIEGLETDIRNDDVIIKDPFFVQEAYTFIYQAGRPVAMGKHRANNTSIDIDLEGETYSDDDIFGKAICNHIRKNSRQNTIVLPK